MFQKKLTIESTCTIQLMFALEKVELTPIKLTTVYEDVNWIGGIAWEVDGCTNWMSDHVQEVSVCANWIDDCVQKT